MKKKDRENNSEERLSRKTALRLPLMLLFLICTVLTACEAAPDLVVPTASPTSERPFAATPGAAFPRSPSSIVTGIIHPTSSPAPFSTNTLPAEIYREDFPAPIKDSELEIPGWKVNRINTTEYRSGFEMIAIFHSADNFALQKRGTVVGTTQFHSTINERGSSWVKLCYAEGVHRGNDEMNKIEYCRLALKRAGTFRNDLVIVYSDPNRPEGVREELVQRKVSFIKINSLLKNVTARLAAEGWEEISVKETEVHFKRLLPD